MTLKNVFKPTASKNTSGKTPAFYNEEKNHCITDMACHKDAIVRRAIVSNEHIPTKVLVAVLETERDKQVLKAALMNDKMPRKAVAAFVNDEMDERVEWFTADEELINHFDRK